MILWFVFCGVKIYGDNNFASIITYIDWYGNVLNAWESEINSDIGETAKIFYSNDNDIITYGYYMVELIGATPIIQPVIARLDTNFQVEWFHHFGEIRSINAQVGLWDIELSSDGHYIGAGESVIEDPTGPDFKPGWLYKFSLEGEEIWSQTYDPPFPLAYNNYGWLTGVGELSSGSIVAGGSAFEGSERYGWIIKVTPDGCIDTLCIMPTTAEEVFAKVAEPTIFPNPSNGQFELELPPQVFGDRVQLRVTDRHGKTMWQEESLAMRQTAIHLESLPPGLYFLTINIGDQRWLRKVVIQ